MVEEVKKISFGFSKISKKTTIVSSKLIETTKEDTKVQFIDCLEGKSIKLKDPDDNKDKPLTIPLKREPNPVDTDFTVSNSRGTCDQDVPKSEINLTLEKEDSVNNTCGKDSVPVKNETLDELAAREIVEDLNKTKTEENTQVFSLPLTSNAPIGEKESSLEDYDNVPVSQFGMAILRGMGWAPGKGIGKNEKVAAPSMPTLRPKGMGLGADKVLNTATEGSKTSDEELTMVKGSFVRIIAGSNKDCYGQIEGFDEESGRIIVHLSIQNISVSINEFMVQIVNKNEFLKNSKVINVATYEKYKESEDNSECKDKSIEHSPEESTNSKQLMKESPDRLITNSTRNYEDKSKSIRSGSSSNTPEDFMRSNKSTSQPSQSHKMKDSQRTRHSRSNSRDCRSSSSEHSYRKKHRSKKKKPSSHKYKSRSRSRSPRDHKYKRHKKRK